MDIKDLIKILDEKSIEGLEELKGTSPSNEKFSIILGNVMTCVNISSKIKDTITAQSSFKPLKEDK